jgi:hypothetical protein
MSDQPTAVNTLDEVRRRRAELRDAISQLEKALAAPSPGRSEEWRGQVRKRLDQLDADFTEHIVVTEGSGPGAPAIAGTAGDGVYSDVVASAPRLARAVDQLRGDHELILKQLGHCRSLVAAVVAPGGATEDAIDEIRDSATDLLFRLVRHRQRGSDLMWEAYASDIGGET